MALKSGDGRTDRVWSATRTRSNMKTRSSHPCLHQPTLQGYAVLLCCSVVHYAATFTVASRTTTRISQHDAVCAPPSMHVTVDRKCGASNAARPAVSRTQIGYGAHGLRTSHCSSGRCNGAAYSTQHAPYRSCSRPAPQSRRAKPCGRMRRDFGESIASECSAGKCASNRPQRTHAHGRVCRSSACSSGWCHCSPTGSNTTAVSECDLLRSAEATGSGSAHGPSRLRAEHRVSAHDVHRRPKPMQQDLFRMDLADNRRQPVVASLPARPVHSSSQARSAVQ